MAAPKVLMAWAHKTDEAREEWARQAVDGWARTAQISQPVSWGEVEAAVLERDYPPLPGRFVMRALGVVGVSALGLLALPIFGAPVLGLALVAVAAGQDTSSEGLLWLARIAFGAAVVLAGVMLSAWWETRRRSVVGLVTAAVTAIASGTACVLVVVPELPEMPWLSVLVFGAATSGLIHLILELLSKPEGRAKIRKPPRRGPRSSDKRLRAGFEIGRAHV